MIDKTLYSTGVQAAESTKHCKLQDFKHQCRQNTVNSMEFKGINIDKKTVLYTSFLPWDNLGGPSLPKSWLCKRQT